MIELDGVQKVVDGHLLLDVKSLSVEAGQAIALVGPEGSGKAQLLELLIGKARPTVGAVRVAGLDPFTDREGLGRSAGVLFAEDGLYTHRSPLSNLEFYCRLYHLPGSRAVEVLAAVGLADHAEVRLDRLSPGLQRRLAFGRAILHRPLILLLAEPFARCDEASISLLRGLVRGQADGGVAVLVLAGSGAHLASLCDAVYALEQGRVARLHTPEQDQPAALPFRIPAREEGREAVVLVNPADILYASAEGGRVFLQTAGRRLRTQFTMSELEGRLARSGFFRAHRGYLVNLQHVGEVIPYTRNSYSLRLDDEARTEIPLSKSAAGELRELLGY